MTETDTARTDTARVWRIKAATRDLVAAVGGQERAAMLCGWARSSVQRWGDAEAARDVINAVAIAALEADCGLPLVTAVLAEINGRAVGPRPGPGSNGPDLMELTAELAAESGEALQTIISAAADGQVSETERRAVADALADVSRVRVQILDRLAMHGAGPDLRVVS